METGIKYDLTGENRRGEIVGYHSKPQPNFLNKSKHNIDVSGLKKATRNGTIIYNDFLEEHESRFTIGMEVEKTRFHRGAVREYELFTGFENDSSCGYEAVTHILPLLPKGFWRNKVLDMMYKDRQEHLPQETSVAWKSSQSFLYGTIPRLSLN